MWRMRRRAEVVSSYLMSCYAGVSLPVIGIGALSATETAGLARGLHRHAK